MVLFTILFSTKVHASIGMKTPNISVDSMLYLDARFFMKQEQKKLDIQQMIAKQQEEKFGDTADPTKFGETISKLDVAMSKKESDRTTDDKLAIEEWENKQGYRAGYRRRNRDWRDGACRSR